MTSIMPDFSVLNTVRLTTQGTADLSTVYKREDRSTIFKLSTGVYQRYAGLSEADKAQISLLAEEKGVDVGDVLLDPFKQAVRESGVYNYVKQQTQGSGLTSKELEQMSLDPSLAPPIRVALQMRADAKRAIVKRWKDVFKYIMSKGNDPSADKARQEAEEQNIRTMRVLNGLDAEGSSSE